MSTVHLFAMTEVISSAELRLSPTPKRYTCTRQPVVVPASLLPILGHLLLKPQKDFLKPQDPLGNPLFLPQWWKGVRSFSASVGSSVCSFRHRPVHALKCLLQDVPHIIWASAVALASSVPSLAAALHFEVLLHTRMNGWL